MTESQCPTAQERTIVRELAKKVMAVAQSDAMATIKRRWRDVNALRKPDRAPVYCRPVGCITELLPDSSLQCATQWVRDVEWRLRHDLVKIDIGDDTPLEPCFDIPAGFDVDPPNLYGVDIARHRPAESDGSWLYDPPLKTPEDLDKLRLPTFSFNAAETERRLARTAELLGETMPVRQVCHPPGTIILCTPAAALLGLTEMLTATLAEPETMHRLMGYLRDWTLTAMDQVQAAGVLTPNITGSLYESDPIGPPAADGKVTYANCWGQANSQEFDPVSPAGFGEFLLDYQMPILQRFGLTHYGCCENLTHKLDRVLTIPNLRIVTCSAWTDLDKVIAACGTKYTIMWRQKASDVVFPDEIAPIRQALHDGARRLQGCRYQIILRELQTLAGHPRRLHDWTATAIAAAEQYAG